MVKCHSDTQSHDIDDVGWMGPYMLHLCCLNFEKLEQLERLRSEDTPRRPV